MQKVYRFRSVIEFSDGTKEVRQLSELGKDEQDALKRAEESAHIVVRSRDGGPNDELPVIEKIKVTPVQAGKN